MTFHECCRAIVAAGTDPKQVRQVNYAVGYASAGLTMAEDSHEAHVQALYIVGNITRWRAPKAKEVRAALKKHGGS